MPSWSPVPVRPFVAAFLRAARHSVGGAGLLHVEGPLTDVVVVVEHEHEDALVVRRVADDTPLDIRLVTRDPHVLETFLVLEVAAAYRQGHELRALGDRRLRPARAYRVVRQPDGWWAVRRRSPGAVVAWHLARRDAVRLASALRHPVETVIEAAKEDRGRPVWTGSVAAPLVRSLLAAVVPLGVVAAVQLPEHIGSPEFVLGTSLGLLACVVGGVWLVAGARLGRRRTERVLDAARPGAPRWRCRSGPGFAASLARSGVREKLPTRRQVEVTLVETPAGIEVWRGARRRPLVRLPWDQVASVDAEPVAGAPSSVLVIRDVRGGRIPLVLLRHREGGQLGATHQVTEEHAAHLRDRYLTAP